MAKKHAVAGTTTDPTIIFTPLEINGETYNLAWTWGAVAQAEKDLGEWVEDLDDKKRVIRRRFVRASLLVGIGEVLYGVPGFGQIGELLYAALKVAHPATTITQAGALIRIDTVADIKNALLVAWGASLPDKESITKDPSVGGAQSES